VLCLTWCTSTIIVVCQLPNFCLSAGAGPTTEHTVSIMHQVGPPLGVHFSFMQNHIISMMNERSHEKTNFLWAHDPRPDKRKRGFSENSTIHLSSCSIHFCCRRLTECSCSIYIHVQCTVYMRCCFSNPKKRTENCKAAKYNCCKFVRQLQPPEVESSNKRLGPV